MKILIFHLLLVLSLGSMAQVSQVPLQTFINAGGATGTITSGIPTHFSAVGQPMVLARPVNTSSGGGIMNANELMFSVFDSSIPLFGTNNTANSVAPGVALVLTADFLDAESGVVEAFVQYRSVNATNTNFTDAPLTKGTGNSWTGSISINGIGELGVEYKFRIRNGAYLQATSQLYRATINHQNGLTITINTNFGKSQKNYRIISIPLVLSSNTVNAVFSAELSGYDENIWRMYRYENGSMNKLSGSSILEPGKGYWFISTKEPTSNINSGAGTTVAASFDQPFEITLKPGWNQIGNPYNFDISWQDVRNANAGLSEKLSTTARSYNGSVIEIDEIKKFEGAYVAFTGTATDKIKIPVTKNTLINGRIKSNEIRNPLDNEHWEVTFDLSNETQHYSLGGVGMHPQANESADAYDEFNIPRFFEYLEVKHPKQLYDMTYTKDIVATQNEYVWNFTTETNQPGKSIILEWDNSYFGNGDEQMWLMDIETGTVWDMRKENKISVDYAPIRRWRVAFGNESYVQEATLPDHNSLIAVYPNPFSREISIEMAISDYSEVKLEILDLNGKNVGTLTSQQMNRGRYVTRWNGIFHGAEEAASGIYIARFQSGTVVQYKRIMKN